MAITARGRRFDLVVRSHRLHAQRFGSPSAPLVLAVHGLSGNLTTFDVLGEHLGGDDRQVVALDLRGRGKSDATAPGTYGWEQHALDLFAVADALGFTRFSVIGHSMGGSVAMKAAEMDGTRLEAVVLVDVAGRVDHGVGPVIARVIDRVGSVHPSFDAYVDAVRAEGLIAPWTAHWDRFYRYDLVEGPGGVRSRARPAAVVEDRAYTSSQDPYDRWAHLTMPTLLLRARRELAPGSGHVVPVADRERFARQVPGCRIVEVDANHLTITADPRAAVAVARFLVDTLGR